VLAIAAREFLMRKLKLIGIGAGNPDYITVQAINALKQVDVVFVTDKGQETADLLRARHEVCERYMQARPYRTVELQDPKRDRAADEYLAAVAAWHEARAALYEQGIRDHLSDGECGAFLVWGDPSLYDSTLRIIDQVTARRTVEFDLEIIPGITSIQALTARHQISLNRIGEPVHVTTGRRLIEDEFPARADVVVLLDGQCAFKTLPADDIDIFWGAYLGTPDEILLSGRLSELRARIEQVRSQARQRKGWIMDTYLLRKRGAPSC
jgi:precorrin-6A synthase